MQVSEGRMNRSPTSIDIYIYIHTIPAYVQCMHIDPHTHTYTHIYTQYIHIYIYICMIIYKYTHIYIYIHMLWVLFIVCVPVVHVVRNKSQVFPWCSPIWSSNWSNPGFTCLTFPAWHHALDLSICGLHGYPATPHQRDMPWYQGEYGGSKCIPVTVLHVHFCYEC